MEIELESEDAELTARVLYPPPEIVAPDGATGADCTL